MIKRLFSLFLLLCTSIVFSQENFDFVNGYYINNKNETVNVLIFDLGRGDWFSNPTQIRFKTSEKSEVQTLDISQVKEFGADDDQFRFIRSTVNIDISSNQLKYLSREREPVFEEKTVFLKMLLSGKISLYMHIGDKLSFYYQMENSDKIEPLIYKKYYVTNDKITANQYYKQQLKKLIDCAEISDNDLTNLGYHKDDMIKIFKKLQSCSNSEFIVYEKKHEIDWGTVHLNLKLGGRNTLVKVSNLDEEQSYYALHNKGDFDSGMISLQGGIELEYVLPFTRNLLSLTTEPTFNKFSGSTSKISDYNVYEFKHQVNYSSVEIPIGLRYYFDISNNFLVFADASYYFANIPIGDNSYSISIINKTNTNAATIKESYDLELSNTFRLGIGCRYKKISLELRFSTASNRLIAPDKHFNVKYQPTSFIFGYRLF